MGGGGSIPSQLLVVLPAFAALTFIKFCELGLERKTPRNATAWRGKVTRMRDVRKVLSVGCDTAWAVGASMVAGLPPLT